VAEDDETARDAGEHQEEAGDELERLDAKTRGPAAIRVTGATP